MASISSHKLRKKLMHHVCRCKFWAACNMEHCSHHQPHSPSEICVLLSPVKYCREVKGFVYDVPIGEAGYNSDSDCDPNLAFKAKREAEEQYRAQSDKPVGILYHNGQQVSVGYTTFREEDDDA